jgi:hypothetical protein
LFYDIGLQAPLGTAEKWIAGLVEDETIFGYINCNALEKAVQKDITEKVASWNWEIDLEEPCQDISKKNVAVGTKTTVSARVCFATLQEVMGKHIVNVIDFEETKAAAMEIILKNKARGPEVVDRVEK